MAMTKVLHTLERCGVLAAVLFGGLLVTTPAQADIVVDDFDVPFSYDLPAMANQPHLNQPDIGQLNATRASRVVAQFSNPTGLVDADISQASLLTLQVNQLNPTSSENRPIVGLVLQYSFSSIDITQGGANDRIVIDFAFLQSSIPLARLDAFVNGRGIGHGGHVLVIPASDGPFSLSLPFDPTLFDNELANGLSLFIAPAYSTSEDILNFSAGIQRVRFASQIPEPTCASIFTIGFTLAILFKRIRSSNDAQGHNCVITHDDAMLKTAAKRIQPKRLPERRVSGALITANTR
jgi:hypothetical protein